MHGVIHHDSQRDEKVRIVDRTTVTETYAITSHPHKSETEAVDNEMGREDHQIPNNANRREKPGVVAESVHETVDGASQR